MAVDNTNTTKKIANIHNWLLPNDITELKKPTTEN